MSQGSFHLVVEGSVVLQSQSGSVSLKAGGASLMLTPGGHAGIKASGSAVYQTQVHTARAPAVMVQGGSSAQVPGNLEATALEMVGPFAASYQLFKTDERPFDGYRYEVRDLEDNILASGKTESDGTTEMVNTRQAIVVRAFKQIMRDDELITEDWEPGLQAAVQAREAASQATPDDEA